MGDIYLDHFLEAQENELDNAISELTVGQKKSHWIWYIFPQVSSLGFSETSKYYGIDTLEEAKAYNSHPKLGANYLACLDALLIHEGRSIVNILGGVDSSKFNSSLTLFKAACKNEITSEKIQRSLDCFFDGKECAKTLIFLSKTQK